MDKEQKKLFKMINSPEKIIKWAKNEIKEYEKIIKIYQFILNKKKITYGKVQSRK